MVNSLTKNKNKLKWWSYLSFHPLQTSLYVFWSKTPLNRKWSFSPHTYACSQDSQGRGVNRWIHSWPVSCSAQTSHRSDDSPALNALCINPWALQWNPRVKQTLPKSSGHWQDKTLFQARQRRSLKLLIMNVLTLWGIVSSCLWGCWGRIPPASILLREQETFDRMRPINVSTRC